MLRGLSLARTNRTIEDSTTIRAHVGTVYLWAITASGRCWLDLAPEPERVCPRAATPHTRRCGLRDGRDQRSDAMTRVPVLDPRGDGPASPTSNQSSPLRRSFEVEPRRRPAFDEGFRSTRRGVSHRLILLGISLFLRLKAGSIRIHAELRRDAFVRARLVHIKGFWYSAPYEDLRLKPSR